MATIATLRDLVDALIVSAKQENQLQEVTSNLTSFFDLIDTNNQLKGSLLSSIFDVEERKNRRRIDHFRYRLI